MLIMIDDRVRRKDVKDNIIHLKLNFENFELEEKKIFFQNENEQHL